MPIRILSSCKVEAAATRTVQLLLEGEYGVTSNLEHYIGVRHDYSNVDEAIRQVKDPALCDEITNRAYEIVNGFDASLRPIVTHRMIICLDRPCVNMVGPIESFFVLACDFVRP